MDELPRFLESASRRSDGALRPEYAIRVNPFDEPVDTCPSLLSRFSAGIRHPSNIICAVCSRVPTSSRECFPRNILAHRSTVNNSRGASHRPFSRRPSTDRARLYYRSSASRRPRGCVPIGTVEDELLFRERTSNSASRSPRLQSVGRSSDTSHRLLPLERCVSRRGESTAHCHRMGYTVRRDRRARSDLR